MKFWLLLLLGTACLVHACELAPGRRLKRALKKIAAVGFLLGAGGYYGQALMEYSSKPSHEIDAHFSAYDCAVAGKCHTDVSHEVLLIHH